VPARRALTHSCLRGARSRARAFVNAIGMGIFHRYAMVRIALRSFP